MTTPLATSAAAAAVAGRWAIGVPGRPGTPEQALAMQVKLLEQQKKSLEKQLADAKKSQGKGKGAAGKAAAAGVSKVPYLESRLRDVTQNLTRKQNSLWEMRGEYEKLLTGENRDAFMAINALFTNYGLGSLAGKIYDYVKNGYSADTISILLQDTDEYKKRFAANEARRKAGISVLSPAEYLSIENSYRQIMRQSGLPVGFYDTNEDFTAFISGDMSPTELQGRVELATQATALANPQYKLALKQMGLSDGELTAYFLDPKRALPFIQKTAATAAIGAEALQRGFAFDQQYAENLATQGVNPEQAAQGYAQIADEFAGLQTLGAIYGGGWTQRQAEEATFTGGTAANRQRERLIGQEKGAFSGAAGSARAGLAGRGGAR